MEYSHLPRASSRRWRSTSQNLGKSTQRTNMMAEVLKLCMVPTENSHILCSAVLMKQHRASMGQFVYAAELELSPEGGQGERLGILCLTSNHGGMVLSKLQCFGSHLCARCKSKESKMLFSGSLFPSVDYFPALSPPAFSPTPFRDRGRWDFRRK